MKNIKKQKKWGFRIIKYSPYELVIITLLLCLGKPFVLFNMVQMIYPAIAGAIGSTLVIRGYKTGKMIYAAIYGGFLGLTGGTMMNRMDLTGIGFLHQLLHGFYLGFCILFGVALVFTLFRTPLIKYISNNTHSEVSE